MQECPFGISVWCSNGGFEGMVWYFNSVSEVMVVLLLLFGWLVWFGGAIVWVWGWLLRRETKTRWEREINTFINSICMGILAFYPYFKKKKFSNMSLFWKYLGSCPCFETRFSQNQVSMKNSICRKSSMGQSNLKKN